MRRSATAVSLKAKAGTIPWMASSAFQSASRRAVLSSPNGLAGMAPRLPSPAPAPLPLPSPPFSAVRACWPSQLPVLTRSGAGCCCFPKGRARALLAGTTKPVAGPAARAPTPAASRRPPPFIIKSGDAMRGAGSKKSLASASS